MRAPGANRRAVARRRAAELTARANELIDMVGLAAVRDQQAGNLSFGQQKLLQFASSLMPKPRLILLDEPLAGMSPTERAETVRLLKSIGRDRTMIVIDHDMDSLFELAGRITVLQEGRVLAEGRPAEIKANPKVQEAYLGGLNGKPA